MDKEHAIPEAPEACVPTDAKQEAKSETGSLADKTPLKKRKRGRNALIVLAVVLVALFGGTAAGYATQHDNPQFCSFICHQPMDSYVESYYSEDDSLAVTAHRQNGITCLQCHDASLAQQVDEGIKWATGNFKDPMDKRHFANQEFCLTKGCHVPFDELVQLTEDYQGSGRNPHESPHGQNACYDCHGVHEQSRIYCTQCHADVEIPKNWR